METKDLVASSVSTEETEKAEETEEAEEEISEAAVGNVNVDRVSSDTYSQARTGTRMFAWDNSTHCTTHRTYPV